MTGAAPFNPSLERGAGQKARLSKERMRKRGTSSNWHLFRNLEKTSQPRRPNRTVEADPKTLEER